jgi:hypothetical protein
VLFILSKSNKGLNICLEEFAGGSFFSPTKSAFTQARKKLCYTVFKKLNRLICDLFYGQAKIKKWKGHRIVSVDGSTLELPDHPSMSEKFSYHRFGPNADAGHFMARISYLYDIFNGIVLDSGMESYSTSEASLCHSHLDYVAAGDLLVCDRYYASFRLFFELKAKGADFLFRMKDNWWKCVEDFSKTGSTDAEYTLKLPAKYSWLLDSYPGLSETMTVRLIKKKDKKGKISIYATSLLDKEKYSAKSMVNLYKQRWGIEEAYKLIKSRLEVGDFSGKTAWAVQQDFYAKTLLISLSNILCHQVKPKTKTGKKTTSKRTLIINRSYALSKTKELLIKIRTLIHDLEQVIQETVMAISAKTEYSKRNQVYKRKFRAQLKYSMNYKSI